MGIVYKRKVNAIETHLHCHRIYHRSLFVANYSQMLTKSKFLFLEIIKSESEVH